MSHYDVHIFVCHNQREEEKISCGQKHGEQLSVWLKEAMKKIPTQKRWRVNKAGCLGICKYGPTLVIYPEGIWYVNVQTREDVEEIVREYMLHGKKVERLLLENVSS
jgi:(2Fe-2S) ferredoxin